MLEIAERRVGDVTVLDLEGNIIMGGGSTLLHNTIRNLIKEGGRKILLNFSGVQYLDSSGVGELVSNLVALNQAGGQLRLLNLSKKTEEVLALSSVLSLFEVYDNESKALSDEWGANI